jgi:ribonuclease P protein component
MFARHMRLTRPNDFETARHSGRHWRDRLLTLNTLPNDLPHSRFGFVVSRRVGKAVMRNRTKRRIRSATHEWLPQLLPGYDLVIVAHPPASGASYAELVEGLGSLFERARLLAGSR